MSVARRGRALLRAMRKLSQRLRPFRDAALARRQQERFLREAQRAHGCARKIRYPREDSAERTRRSREAQGSGPLHVYLCEHCGGYHLAKGTTYTQRKDLA